ncbi:MAG: hypothetical protein B6D56_00500 [Candidatus Omnitrophica bacterium 4484_70.1]|nr:MAG: hypothetical protein B6D56_00500 [Candidatus Omnitrophica bacterium 4484_70.1]
MRKVYRIMGIIFISLFFCKNSVFSSNFVFKSKGRGITLGSAKDEYREKRDFQKRRVYVQVLLKNGNTLEGEILEETEEYIILSILEGKGRTKIRKEKIVSIKPIKKSLKSTQSSTSKLLFITESPFAKKEEILLEIIIFIILGLVIFISYLILIFKAPRRPLGVRLICFFWRNFFLYKDSFLFNVVLFRFERSFPSSFWRGRLFILF